MTEGQVIPKKVKRCKICNTPKRIVSTDGDCVVLACENCKTDELYWFKKDK